MFTFWATRSTSVRWADGDDERSATFTRSPPQADALAPLRGSWHRPPGSHGPSEVPKWGVMARSDLLINLVKAGAAGDLSQFRKVVDLLVAEERSKNHDVLADRLMQAATPAQSNGNGHHAPRFSSHAPPSDLYHEIVPKR